LGNLKIIATVMLMISAVLACQAAPITTPSSSPTPTLSVTPTLPTPAVPLRTFTWIYQVDAEKAKWADDLGFTDVVVPTAYSHSLGQNPQTAYANITACNMTYWCAEVDLAPMANATVDAFKKQLEDFLKDSPNKHVYLDFGAHIVLRQYGENGLNNLCEAIREEEAGCNCSIILDGYTASDAAGPSDCTLDSNQWCGMRYTSIDMSGVSYDTASVPEYDYPIGAINGLHAGSFGIYLWAEGYHVGGTTWDTMTRDEIYRVYREAVESGAARIGVYCGYMDLIPSRANNDPQQCSLYYHPQWWNIIRQFNTEVSKDAEQ